MNFRHLLGCDTIAAYQTLTNLLQITVNKSQWADNILE